VRKSVQAADALDAASVLVDVLLAVVVAVALVVAFGLGRRWLGPALRTRQEELPVEPRDAVSVPSWRPGTEPPSIALPPPSAGTYGGIRRVAPRYPEDPGRLL
jgi:hypothetical protein